jgi:hypothetical protein
MTDTTLHHSWQSSPPTRAAPHQIMLDRSLDYLHGGVTLLVAVKACFFVHFQVTIQIFRWLSKIFEAMQ